VKIGKEFLNHGSIDKNNRDLIEIGNYVTLGNSSRLLMHGPFMEKKKTILHNFVWIGYGCILLPGIEIKQCTIVGAGSVVTKDQEPFSIVAGNPARKIRRMSREQIEQYVRQLFHRIKGGGAMSYKKTKPLTKAEQAELNKLLSTYE
jgi:serine acetyltransferase